MIQKAAHWLSTLELKSIIEGNSIGRLGVNRRKKKTQKSVIKKQKPQLGLKKAQEKTIWEKWSNTAIPGKSIR